MAKQLNAWCLGFRILGQSFWGTGALWDSVGRSSVPTEPSGGIQVAKLPAQQRGGKVVLVLLHTSGVCEDTKGRGFVH